MDRSKRVCILSLAVAAVAIAGAASADLPLRASRWLAPEARTHALAYEPTECLSPPRDEAHARRLLTGRAAFRTPLLLGGLAARTGLSCNSCHRSGRGNPDFLFPGLSSKPGTADVTSSLTSSHRGDGIFNPIPIPDLSGARTALKVSRAPADGALETFIRRAIVEEFDGPEPDPATLAALAAYVRALSPDACPAGSEQRQRLGTHIADADAAIRAARYALAAGNRGTARLMVSAARSALGSIEERYHAPTLADSRRGVLEADRELAGIQAAIDAGRSDAPALLLRWRVRSDGWTEPLRRGEGRSLFGWSMAQR